MFFGETKVENVAGIVPSVVSGRSGHRLMESLYDDERAGECGQTMRWRERRDVPCIIAYQVDRTADLSRTRRGEDISADGSWCKR